MKLRLICTLMIIMFFSTSVNAEKMLKTDVETKRLQAGTKFNVQLLEPVSSSTGAEGDYFSAILLDNQNTKTHVILPAGSIIRGSVNKIVPNKMLSRGAIIFLDFDHIVTPNGRQLPLDMAVCGRVNVNLDGGVYVDKGYGEALKKNWGKTVDITSGATNKGIEAGDKIFNGGGKIITVPVCALGGALGGGIYLVGDSVIDLFRQGAEVELQQDQVLTVILTHPIDVPVN